MKSEFLPTDNRGSAAMAATTTTAAASTRRAKPGGEKKIKKNRISPRKNDRNAGAVGRSRMDFAVSWRVRACGRARVCTSDGQVSKRERVKRVRRPIKLPRRRKPLSFSRVTRIRPLMPVIPN